MNRVKNIARNFDVQRFAAGDNNDLAARSYQLEFKQLLQAVFRKRSYFADFFGGGIEVLNGVRHNETAFYVKTSDIPVVIGTYDTGANVAFGSGTSKSNRFGEMTEVIYTDTPVQYSWNWAYNEGLDRFTVNNDMEDAIADRLELQAQKKTAQFNAHHGAFISACATGSQIFDIAAVTSESVNALFAKLDKYFTDIEAVGTRRAKVTAEVYNAIIDGGLAVTSKNADVNISNNRLPQFKDFLIEKVPASMFQTNEVVYAYIEGIGKAFTGINTARTVESENFDGVALQGAGKAGEYILPDNKKAVVKARVTGA